MIVLEYDPEADALFASFRHIGPGEVRGAQVLDDQRNVHYDYAGEAVGVEFLYVSHGINLSGVPRAEEINAALRAFRALPAA